MHNADPRIFEDTVTIEKLDYSEALELSYYGASVIHPRTVKPLQNRNIPLYVKSFVNPKGPFTCIGDFPEMEVQIPMYISRSNTTCLSLGLLTTVCVTSSGNCIWSVIEMYSLENVAELAVHHLVSIK